MDSKQSIGKELRESLELRFGGTEVRRPQESDLEGPAKLCSEVWIFSKESAEVFFRRKWVLSKPRNNQLARNLLQCPG